MKNIYKILLGLGTSICLFIGLGIAQANASTFNVNTTLDIDQPCLREMMACSLRGAINTSNMVGGENTINLPAGTYELDPYDLEALGDASLVIESDITIIGDDVTNTIIDGMASDSVLGTNIFEVNSGYNFEVQNVTLQNGHAWQINKTGDVTDYAGGISSFGGNVSLSNVIFETMDGSPISGYISSLYAEGGTLYLENVVFQNSKETAHVFEVSNEEVQMVDVEFLNNDATYVIKTTDSNMGLTRVDMDSNTGTGIYLNGVDSSINTTVIQDSSITDNGDAGIFVFYDPMPNDITILNSDIIGNDGRGIYLTKYGDLYIEDSTINENQIGIYIGMGTVELINSEISYNAQAGLRMASSSTIPEAYLSGVTIDSNGHNFTTTDQGSGVYNGCGTLEIENSVISNNYYYGYTVGSGGGGLVNGDAKGSCASSANAIVTDTRFEGNTTNKNGGAILNQGTIDLSNVQISNNEVGDGWNGGGIYNGGTMTIENAEIMNNYAYGSTLDPYAYGGGIFNAGELEISNSQIYDNEAGYSGGGIMQWMGTATITETEISGNVAGLIGGGIAAISDLMIEQSLVDSNIAEAGGGPLSTCSVPASGGGGGIAVYADGIGVMIENTTISRNEAQNAGNGGGLLVSGASTIDIIQSTIVDNLTESSEGGGLYINGSTTVVNMTGTILANNTSNISPNCGSAHSTNGIQSGGYNIIGDSSTCSMTSVSTDQVDVDPLLESLADNGGETKTYALQISTTGSSPAISIIPYTDCLTLKDQRGEYRYNPGPYGWVGGYCDAGAYETEDTDADGMPDEYEEAAFAGGDGGMVVIENIDADEDFDGDGVTNFDEFRAGTDPMVANIADTDGDGVYDDVDVCSGTTDYTTVDADGCSDSQRDSDGDGMTDDLDACDATPSGEIGDIDANGCGPSEVDTDGDGVYDDVDVCPLEDATGYDSDGDGCIDPILDTDGDGINDEDEIAGVYGYVTDETMWDTDGDGLSDYEEIFSTYTYDSDPTQTDSDSDGVYSDYNEVMGTYGYVTDPMLSDTDADGYSDVEEYTLKSDPTSYTLTLHNCDTYNSAIYGTWTAAVEAESVATDTGTFMEGWGSTSFNVDTEGAQYAYMYFVSPSTFDLSSYSSTGSINVWVYIPDVTDFSYVYLQWGNDDHNLWKYATYTTSDGNAFSTGWNHVSVDWSAASVLGSPDATLVDYFVVVMGYDAGYVDQTGFRLDSLVIE